MDRRRIQRVVPQRQGIGPTTRLLRVARARRVAGTWGDGHRGAIQHVPGVALRVVLRVEVLQVELLCVRGAEGVGDGGVGEAVEGAQGAGIGLTVAAQVLGIGDDGRQRGGGDGGSCAGACASTGRWGAWERPDGEDGACSAELDAVAGTGAGATRFGNGGRGDSVAAVALGGILQAEVEIVSAEAGRTAQLHCHACRVGERIATECSSIGSFGVASSIGCFRTRGEGQCGVSRCWRRHDWWTLVIGVLPYL